MSIRTDLRQWLIYDKEAVTTVVGAIETMLMALGAMTLIYHPDQELRAIGNFGQRAAQTRLDHWADRLKGLEPTNLQKELAGYVERVSAYLGGEAAKPEAELDEIQAALVWLDKRVREAGVSGPGWYREIVRESTLGR